MTVQEITDLRKNGRLKEALQAAEIEYAQAKNNFTGGALFWCLYDISKQKDSAEELTELYNRMTTLFEEAKLEDKGINFMKTALSNLERRINPVGQEIKEAITALKSGASADITRLKVEQMFLNGELNQNLYQDYGWLIYYTLKGTPVGEVQKRKILLRNYLKLSINGKNPLHSLILSEAVKVERNTPLQFRIRDFVKLWDLENLRDEDWRQFMTDNGITIPSLVEKLVGVYAKELKADKVKADKEFIELADKAFERYTNNQYMPLYKAYILISSDKPEEALEFYKGIIMKTPSKCYLWEQAAEIVDDVEMRIGLLCKAISVEKDESFVGGCRLNLAKALIEYGLLPNAKCELDKYYNFYTSQGWGLKQDFKEVVNLIPQETIAENNTSLYNEFIPKAETFIYSAIPSQFAIKIEDRQIDDKKRPGRKFIQWTLMTKNGTIRLKKPNNFGLDSRMKNGTPFDIKIHEDKIVWIKQSEENPLGHDWIKTQSGIVRLRADRNGKKYAIIDGTYVGEKHLRNITDGQNVKLVAVRQEDGRWSAISLAKL